MFIDLWYGNNKNECDKIDIYFNDMSCKYSGNIYKNGHIIGDYVANNCEEIEKAFRHLAFNWG